MGGTCDGLTELGTLELALASCWVGGGGLLLPSVSTQHEKTPHQLYPLLIMLVTRLPGLEQALCREGRVTCLRLFTGSKTFFKGCDGWNACQPS